MTNSSLIALLALGFSLAALCPAQTVPYSRNALTNRDVVVLAKAGFNEDFIIDTILGSRTQFDTRVDGLAELAKQGMTERVIRVMMTCEDNRPASAPERAGPVVYAALAPPADAPGKVHVTKIKTSPVHTAVSTQTPYYQWTSCFFGLWKRRISVGAVVQQPGIGAHLGVMYQQVQAPRAYASPQTLQVTATHPVEAPLQP